MTNIDTMKSFKFLITIIFILSSFMAISQSDDDVLLIVEGEEFTVGEFLYVYNKNNVGDQVIDKKTVEEYLDLFVNFRLKVKDAESLGLDTNTEFLRELEGYRKQLAKPYLTDKEVTDELLKEAYNRRQLNLRASHIMISVPETVADNDSASIAAVQKLNNIKKKIENGADFAEMAKKHSDDPSARDAKATRQRPAREGNGGDLGYFTAFYLVYPFENAVYNLEVGEISDPVRTKFGYHIIKLTDRTPALGKINAAHINIKVKDSQNEKLLADMKSKANEIYEQIKNGEISFEEAAKRYSDDKGSADKGGKLPLFEVNRMVPEFIEAITELEEGEISKPVLTRYGYHIIKLIDLDNDKTFDDSKAELQKLINRDSRSNRSKEAAVEKFKNEFDFKEYSKGLEKFYDCVDSSLFDRNWSADKAKDCNKKIFKLDGKKYKQYDFAKYLETQQKFYGEGTKKYFINKIYKKYVDKTIMDYKNSMLEKQYEDFRLLMKEYHDGILLFNVSDKKVWGKAIQDSAGLQKFYEENKDNYMWDKRVDAEVWTCKNDSIANLVKEMIKNGINKDTIIEKLNQRSKLNVNMQRSKFEAGANEFVDKAGYEKGLSKNFDRGNIISFVNVIDVLEPSPKKLEEAKGLITADYQNYLEEQWLKELHEKYEIIVNEDVLEKLKEKHDK